MSATDWDELPRDLNALLPRPVRECLCTEPGLERAFVVGGFVRDALLEKPSKDIDIEVFGRSVDDLVAILRRLGRVDLVGKSFGVIKVTMRGCDTVDFSLPRRDSKTGPGHRGFEAEVDATMSLREASTRRDFTINALYYDPRRKVVLDCHQGARDLEEQRLRAVDKTTFCDDPLRVLRAMQFSARFGYRADSELIELSRSMIDSFSELPGERVGEEWLKWGQKSTRPSLGLKFLVECGWIRHFPELDRIRDVPQDPEWHPEGNVFQHTSHCCDALVELPEWQGASPQDRLVLLLAILLHDIGKAETTDRVVRQGRERIVSPGHEGVSANLAPDFLKPLKLAKVIEERVVPLVANHMIHFEQPTDRAVRRLAHRLKPETIENLVTVMTADSHGRPPLPKSIPRNVELLLDKSRSMALAQAAPQPILQGRDLLELGYQPGPELGVILREAFAAQLEGEFHDREGGFDWVARRST